MSYILTPSLLWHTFFTLYYSKLTCIEFLEITQKKNLLVVVTMLHKVQKANIFPLGQLWEKILNCCRSVKWCEDQNMSKVKIISDIVRRHRSHRDNVGKREHVQRSLAITTNMPESNVNNACTRWIAWIFLGLQMMCIKCNKSGDAQRNDHVKCSSSYNFNTELLFCYNLSL